MAIVIDSLPIHGMKASDFAQLLSYVYAREHEGWYSGRKDYFEERHERIKSWLEFWVEELRKSDVRIPK